MAFVCLLAALVAQWSTNLTRYWPWLVCISLITALYGNLIDPAGLIVPAVVLAFWYLIKDAKLIETPWQVIVIRVVVLLLCLALALHVVPGFNNIAVVQDAVIKTGAKEYSFWINYDKALCGVFLLAFFVPIGSLTDQLKPVMIWTLAGLSAVVVVVFLPSYALGYIDFEAGWPAFIALWIPSNLLITVVAEEAFFRGVIQNQAANFLRRKNVRHPLLVAVLIASLLFAVAHLAGGVFFIVASFITGLVYGYVYVMSSRLETAILVHFLVNLFHISLFTYPVLSS